jgi:acetyl esterase/lipase
VTTADTFETAVYSRPGQVELGLDVFRPPAAGRGAAVLVFHGGGWRVGSREFVHARTAALAAQGFTAIAVQYRLLDVAPWPAPLADAAAALAWVRDNAARLEIDPAKVAVQGHSAGGHIALLSGTFSKEERPAAVIAYYPAIGFYPAPPPAGPAGPPSFAVDELGRVPGWMLFPPHATQADLDAASPIAQVNPGFPPTALLHGTADSAIPFRASVNLHRRLTELGVPSDLHLYAGRNHEFDMAPSICATAVAAVASFLDRMVTEPDRNDEEIRRYPFPPSADD